MHDDHAHGHFHDHSDGHSHGHSHGSAKGGAHRHHDHDDGHSHGPGHNHPHPHGEHLHSHVGADVARERAAELRTLATAFVDGFRKAADKTSFLRIAGIPFSRKGTDGLTMHLVDVQIETNWQIGTASPAFGSRELVYLPYPGELVSERETMRFTYVSLTERQDAELVELLKAKAGE